MKLAALTRIIATVMLAGLFVSDYMFNLWIKEVPREAYLLMVSVALGVDIEFLRNVLINSLSKTLSGPSRREEEDE